MKRRADETARARVRGRCPSRTGSRAELTHQIIDDYLDRRRSADPAPPRLLFDSNGHGISLAARDPEYRRSFETADVVHADGGWIVLASHLPSGAKIAERSATTDLIHDLVAAGIEPGISHYLLGATEEVNASCTDRLRQMHPGIAIAGQRHGYFSPRKKMA